MNNIKKIAKIKYKLYKEKRIKEKRIERVEVFLKQINNSIELQSYDSKVKINSKTDY